MWKILTLIIK